MNDIYYDMIFKRKSFHIFKETQSLTKDDIGEIEHQIKQLIPLVKEIDVVFRVVPKQETTCKRGEYCILIYSEIKDHYLQNVGYLGEQLDLWLASKNIGGCWYGVGNPDESRYNGLDFVIMLAIAKTDKKTFRKDYTKSKRKPLNEIWNGLQYQEIASVIRYAPSACNTQPWYIECKDNKLSLYRVKGKRGIMPKNKVVYYNRIDIGIMMFFLEVCLIHEKYDFSRELFLDFLQDETRNLIAKYSISISCIILRVFSNTNGKR